MISFCASALLLSCSAKLDFASFSRRAFAINLLRERSGILLRNSAAKSWGRVIFILCVCIYTHFIHTVVACQASRAWRPGSLWPDKNSSIEPPPVETKSNLFNKFIRRRKDTVKLDKQQQ